MPFADSVQNETEHTDGGTSAQPIVGWSIAGYVGWSTCPLYLTDETVAGRFTGDRLACDTFVPFWRWKGRRGWLL